MKLLRIALLVWIPAVIVPLGCRDSGAAPGGRLRVVCTTGMIADAARYIAGDRAEVTGLMGPGVDPHLYPMSRNDQLALSRAGLVIYHGLHLEGKMASFLHGLASADSGQLVVAAAESVPKERLILNEAFGEYPDPHVWFDLELWKFVADEITRALQKKLPEHADEFASRGKSYVESLDATQIWAREAIAKLPKERRRIVTSHDAYNYFARAYEFEVYGLQGISTETKPGMKDIQSAISYIRRHRVPVVFAETSVSESSVILVAKKSGCRLAPRKLYSDALGRPQSKEGTLIGMFRYNLETIIEALSPETSPAKP